MSDGATWIGGPGAKHDIGSLLTRARQFKETLTSIKQKSKSRSFEWYPYDSLANLEHLDALLKGSDRDVLGLASDGGVADIGCADGDLAFFLESVGFQVHAIDYPVANHNHMLGLRTLHAALESQVQIHEVDLDSQFFLPEKTYQLIFLLGALYHLKNPFYVMDALSNQSRFCFLSTRIMSRTPTGLNLKDLPLAYLTGEVELNDDDSNFWIFSEMGLRRLLDRTNWEVVSSMSIEASGTPDALVRDERFFCLLRSRHGVLRKRDASANIELVQGWHAPENRGWRWTERCFRVRAQRDDRELSRLRLKLYLPPALLEGRDSVTLRVRVNGSAMRAEAYTCHGDQEFVCGFPKAHDVTAEFDLSHGITPDRSDPRELGVIVASIEFE